MSHHALVVCLPGELPAAELGVHLHEALAPYRAREWDYWEQVSSFARLGDVEGLADYPRDVAMLDTGGDWHAPITEQFLRSLSPQTWIVCIDFHL